MKIVDVFEYRLQSEQNGIYLANMAQIVAAHEKWQIGPSSTYEGETRHNLIVSSTPFGRSVVIDRTTDTIATAYDVVPEDLIAFAQSGIVADIGCGTSTFLDTFKGVSETVAVDLHPLHVYTQTTRGHKGIEASAEDMADVESGSVRLLNASWSQPFWSLNPEQARAAFREYGRVLEIGGIALVGGISNKDIHLDWENCVQSMRLNCQDRLTVPWQDGDNAFISHTLSAFIEEALKAISEGSLFHGHIDIVGNRYSGDLGMDYRSGSTSIHLPNYLMLRRAS